MIIDIDQALNAGNLPRQSRTWFDRLPVDVQQQLRDLRAAVQRERPQNLGMMSRNLMEQLTSHDLPCPKNQRTIEQWLTDDQR